MEAAGIKNWVSLSEGQQGTLGWLTTNERKQQMCLLLREALTVGKIAIAHEFFSNELKLVEARLRIKDELSSYCVVTEPPKTTFGKVTPVILRRYSRTQRLHHGALRRCARLIRENSTENRTTYASRSN